MPTIRAHSLYEASIFITVASRRPEGVPSHIIPNAKLHDELASRLRGAFKEFRHLNDNALWVPIEKQIATHLASTGSPAFYAVRTLDPAGAGADTDMDFFLDILRIRYNMVFAVLPGALLADEGKSDAYESNWQRAWRSLLVNTYQFKDVFIPEDDGERPDEKTNIDLTVEMGPARGTMPFNQPQAGA